MRSRRYSFVYTCLWLAGLAVVLLTACRRNTASSSVSSAPAAPAVQVPDFNADSAFAYVERQVAFGPRVPNTEAHRRTAAYLADELRRHGAQVISQNFQVRGL